MSIVTSSTSPVSSSAGTQVERTTGGGGVGKSDFLRLLTEQLRHQDPLNPMEDKDMMAQLAQFSALEETQAMRTSLDKLAAGDQMAQGASFLGKSVTGTTPPTFDAYGSAVAGQAITGVVTGASFRDGQVYLKVGTTEMPMTYVTSIETVP